LKHTFENHVGFNKKFILIIKHVISKNKRSNKTRLFSTGISENKGRSSQKLHYRENWRELTKLLKPVIKTQNTVAKDLAKEITEPVTSALQPITEGVQKAIELAKYPSIQAAKTDQDIDTSMVILGTVIQPLAARVQ